MDRLTTAVIASAVLSLPYSAQAQSNAPTGGKLTTFPIASTPYTGQEVCYMVQGGVSKQYPCAPAGGSTIGTVTHVICGAGLGGGTITATGTCYLLPQEQFVSLSFSSNAIVQTGTYGILASYRPANAGDTLVVDSVDAYTGGSASPAWTAELINGSATLTCGGGQTITVGTVDVLSSCSADNTIASGSLFELVALTVTGTPDNSVFQISYHWVP